MTESKASARSITQDKSAAKILPGACTLSHTVTFCTGMVKTSQNWLTHLLFATPQAPRLGLVGAVSLHNTIMASNMILNTSQTTSKAEKMVSGWF